MENDLEEDLEEEEEEECQASGCKRKLEEKERELATKDEKIKRLKTLCTHLLANCYQQESKPKKAGEEQSKKIKGNATHLLVPSAGRM